MEDKKMKVEELINTFKEGIDTRNENIIGSAMYYFYDLELSDAEKVAKEVNPLGREVGFTLFTEDEGQSLKHRGSVTKIRRESPYIDEIIRVYCDKRVFTNLCSSVFDWRNCVCFND